MPARLRPVGTAPDNAASGGTAKSSLPRPGAAFLLAGFATASVLAAISLIISALVVRALLGSSGQLSTALIASGTLVGTCLGSWASQPKVTRLVYGLLNAR
jgi:hypothetical protein